MNPVARKSDIYVESLAEEVILYDKRNHNVHRLNSMAAVIWEHCNGTNTLDDLTHIVQKKCGASLNGDLVVVTLRNLSDAGLLVEQSEEQIAVLPSRREMAHRLLKTGVSVSLIPVITSIVAPLPAAARSQDPWTCQQYQKELSTVSSDVAQHFNEFERNGLAQQDFAAGFDNGTRGIVALENGDTAAANADFNAATSDFDGVLKALGLPPL